MRRDLRRLIRKESLSLAKWQRCLLVLAIVGLALLLTHSMHSDRQALPYFVPLTGIALTAYVCGTWSGLISLLLINAAIVILYLSPAPLFYHYAEYESLRFVLSIVFELMSLGVLDRLRRTTQVAQDGENRFHDLVDHLDHAIVWETDQKNLEIKFVSKRCKDLLGYSKEEWMALGPDLWKTMVPQEDQPALRALLREAQSGKISDTRCEHRFIRKGGGCRWFQTGFNLRDPQDPNSLLYGLSVEITPWKEAQEANDRGKLELEKLNTQLSEKSALLRTLVEAMPQMAFVASSDGTLYLNRRHYEYFGLKYGDVKAWQALEPSAHHPDEVAFTFEKWNASMKTGDPFEREFRLKRYDGEWRWHLGRAVPVRNNNGEIIKWIGTNTDIHELKEAKQSAEAANKAKTYFLANMSHEIRTPLGVIQGYAELLSESGALDPEDRQMAKTITRNTKQLTEIIGEILDVSKIEANKLDVEFIKFSLQDLIEDVKSILSFKAEQKDIKFRVVLEGDTPKYIVSDPVRLKQILLNLGGNAIKFTNRGFVEVRFSCLKPYDYEDACGTFKIEVEDTGIGITPNAQAKLFQPFVQADASMTRRFGGTGLGLHISKKLAAALGGNLELTSSVPGKGSIFTLTLTRPNSEKIGIYGLKSKRQTESAGRLNGAHLLLVEDSLDNQALLTRMLSKEGAIVKTASDGREGLNSALKGNFDLVLMDIQMPELDGWQAVGQLRQKNYRKPIIALTAHALSEEKQRSMESGFDDYLTKPVNRELMISTIKRLLETQRR